MAENLCKCCKKNERSGIRALFCQECLLRENRNDTFYERLRVIIEREEVNKKHGRKNK